MTANATVYEVLYHVPDDSPAAHGGAAGDGSFTFRTRDEKEAQRVAGENSYYGRPAKVLTSQVPRRLAARWGLA